MKTLYYASAFILAALSVDAQTDLSDRNDGLPHRIQCTNVPAASGSVDGFYAANIGYFVSERHADRATTDRIAGIVPAHFDVRDEADVRAYLASVGLSNFEMIIRSPGTKRRVVITEVETTIPGSVENVPVPRGDFDGTDREWRVTSMDGTNTVRVRTSDDRPVDLRIAGTTVLTVTGKGEAFFDLPAGQSFGGIKIHDATTGEALRNSTTSTNGNIWDGTIEVTTPDQVIVTEVESTISIPDRGGLKWCYGRRG